MKPKPSHLLPAPTLLRELLHYEPETGKLYWKSRDISMFRDGAWTAEHRWKAWNSTWANKEAFTAIDHRGYHEGTLLSRVYRAHRIVWALVHGEWPTDQIDHLNGNGLDNRIINLRVVPNRLNGKNLKRSKRNTSGVTGVSWQANMSKWSASIHYDGKSIHLGYFSDINDAAAARKSAEAIYEYHPNHGRATNG